MKRIFIPAIFALAATLCFAQTNVKKPAAQSSAGATPSAGYTIPFTLTPYKNCWLYMGTYFGKNTIMIDSARVSATSTGVFKGKKKLTPGLYFFISPARTKLFEFIVDATQHFTITGDSTSPQPTTVVGSPDNTLLLDYIKFISEIGPKMNDLDVQLKDPNLAADRAEKIKAQRSAYAVQLRAYQLNVVKTHPNAILAVIFNLMQQPDIPTKLPLKADGTIDSSYIGRFVKEHYWDGVAFNDDRVLHNTVFDPKLETYIKYYVSPDPDSISAEINYMLLYARTSKEMFHYLLGRFTDKYINPEIMGQDKVFIFLFENYFAKGDTLWLNATQRKYIFDRYYSLKTNVLGEPAPSLELVDTAGKPSSLYNVKAPFTVVIFWDPTCSHCKEEIPRYDSIYQAKWKAEGVKIFAVNVNEATLTEWKEFLKDNKLTTWIHAWQTKAAHDADTKAERPNFRQLYDVFQTPTIYLLDAQKRIIAKRLSVLQFDGLIDMKIKNPNPVK